MLGFIRQQLFLAEGAAGLFFRSDAQDDTPNASYYDIATEDLKEAEGYGSLMGQKALGNPLENHNHFTQGKGTVPANAARSQLRLQYDPCYWFSRHDQVTHSLRVDEVGFERSPPRIGPCCLPYRTLVGKQKKANRKVFFFFVLERA